MKKILLGLLLMPCVAHTMGELPVTKIENGLTTQYIRGEQVAERKYTRVGIYYTSGIVRDGGVIYTTRGEKAEDLFDELAAAAKAQQE
jgi:hypothetical protein